jgi:hypothetical protein
VTRWVLRIVRPKWSPTILGQNWCLTCTGEKCCPKCCTISVIFQSPLRQKAVYNLVTLVGSSKELFQRKQCASYPVLTYVHTYACMYVCMYVCTFVGASFSHNIHVFREKSESEMCIFTLQFCYAKMVPITFIAQSLFFEKFCTRLKMFSGHTISSWNGAFQVQFFLLKWTLHLDEEKTM